MRNRSIDGCRGGSSPLGMKGCELWLQCGSELVSFTDLYCSIYRPNDRVMLSERVPFSYDVFRCDGRSQRALWSLRHCPSPTAPVQFSPVESSWLAMLKRIQVLVRPALRSLCSTTT